MSMRIPEGGNTSEIDNNNNAETTENIKEKGQLNGRKAEKLEGTEKSSDSFTLKMVKKLFNNHKSQTRRRASLTSINWNRNRTVTADYTKSSKLWSTSKKIKSCSVKGNVTTKRRKGKGKEEDNKSFGSIDPPMPKRKAPKLPDEVRAKLLQKNSTDVTNQLSTENQTVEESEDLNSFIPPERTALTTKNDRPQSKQVKSSQISSKEKRANKRLPGLQILNQDIKQLEARIKSETASMKGASEGELEDVKQTVGNIKTQLKNMKNFKSFVIQNSKGLERIRKDTKEAIMQSESIFDGNINTATKNAAEDTDKLFENAINSLPDNFDTSKIEEHRKEIQDKSYEMIGKYIPRKKGLFLAGMFSKYKNELGNVKNDPSAVKMKNIKSPSALDMIKSAGNDIKLIDDELVPSFVASIHKERIMGDFLKGKGIETTKGAVASLTETQQASNLKKFEEITGSKEAARELNKLYTSLTHDYKARAVKSKAYLDNAPEFINLLKKHKII